MMRTECHFARREKVLFGRKGSAKRHFSLRQADPHIESELEMNGSPDFDRGIII